MAKTKTWYCVIQVNSSKNPRCTHFRLHYPVNLFDVPDNPSVPYLEADIAKFSRLLNPDPGIVFAYFYKEPTDGIIYDREILLGSVPEEIPVLREGARLAKTSLVPEKLCYDLAIFLGLLSTPRAT